ncbi:MAG: protein kinase [Minicystis sp.]
MSLEIGAAIKHYEIIRELGKGGMGIVYLARDTKLGRLVAIKLLLEWSGYNAAHFLEEARATARCRHENIVVIHEVDEIRGYPYMVLEYIHGQTLRAWMSQRGRAGELAPLTTAPPGLVSPLLAIELVIPVVRALICAHQTGIVHRDLKPENILLDDAGSVRVLDFGIAKQIETSMMSRLTSTLAVPLGRAAHPADSAVAGTAPYMSPEQLLGSGTDPRADLWAVGIMLYELVAGAHPLAPFSLAQLTRVVDLDEPMPSAGGRPEMGALGPVIDHCLKKRKAERVGSAAELLAELEALLPARKAIALDEDENPFAGLAAFQEADAGRFFGRDRDITATLARLRQEPALIVAGPSGAGKSSFVRAGVIPALKCSGRPWEAFILRPGRRPLSALVDVLAQLAEAEPTGAGAAPPPLADHDALVATLRAQPGHLGARLRARCRRKGPGYRILLFVDQFEELYTLGAPPEERAAFSACLEGAADDASSPLRVLLAIRSDFLVRLADERHFLADVPHGLSFLPPMRREGLREALTRPIEAAGHRFETEEMIACMLDALESTHSPLPLLQFTAAKLWEMRDRERRLLTRDSHEQLGGVAGALSAHADAVLAGLSIDEQRLARAVLLRLVTPERTRAVVSLDELCELAQDREGNAADTVRQVIHHLAAARLLLIETGGEREGTLVELIHESLIDRWAKLRQWLAASEQDAQFLARLRAAALAWDAGGRSEGLLWRDRAAEKARAWYERRRADQGADWREGLSQREELYLLDVLALADRARSLRRRLWVGVTATLGAIALVVSYLALRAAHETARAQAEAVQARNATRMATAREQQANPTTVIAILREIEPPDVPRGWFALARWALHDRIADVVLIHPDGVTSASESPDGKRIVTASLDRIARVWNADGTGEPILLRGHDDRVLSAAWSPDGRRVVTGSYDRTARVWNADGTGEPIVLRGHEDRIYAAAWSPDGKRIVTASADRTVRVWNADGTGEPLVLRGHDDEVMDAAFSPDEKRIASTSLDKTARVWSADGTGQPVILRGHEDGGLGVAWSPDGKRIVTASRDDTARVWNADGTGLPIVLRGHEHWVYAAAWSPDGKRIVTASFDKTARVWNADGTGEPLILRGHEDGVRWAAWSPDGKHVITASLDKTVRVWSALGPNEPLMLKGHQDSVASAAFSPDGKRIVTASADTTARVWNADGGGEPLVLRGHTRDVASAAWSPDGKRIATASHDKTVRVWNADGTGEPLVLRGHDDRVYSVAWSPDGKRIASASYDKTARVWNADGTGQPLVLRGHGERVYAVAWSPDGKRIATASHDKTVRVWNADGTGEPLILRGHEDGVRWVAWSPDGKRIVTASYDKTARVWNADGTGQPLVLRGHEHWVLAAAFSPDGRRIVTASEDRTARVWKSDGTGEHVVLRGSDSSVNHVDWSPDGERIVASSDDKIARVWTHLEPLHGVDDPQLWIATTYCMPIARRMDLFRVSEPMARANREACLHRVAGARAARSR